MQYRVGGRCDGALCLSWQGHEVAPSPADRDPAGYRADGAAARLGALGECVHGVAGCQGINQPADIGLDGLGRELPRVCENWRPLPDRLSTPGQRSQTVVADAAERAVWYRS